MTASDVRVQITAIRTVAVPVRDQERALAFYTGVLGLVKGLDAPFGGGRWIEPALVTDRPAGADTDPEVLRCPGCRRCSPSVTPTAIGRCSWRTQSPGSRWCS